jgi:cysteine-rich repeat protein
VPLIAGDTCDAAQWLVNGTYPMDGFTPDMQCMLGSCNDPSRWFRIDVPSGKVLDLKVSSANIDYGEVGVLDLAGGYCAAMNNIVLSGGFGSSQGPLQRVFVNQRYETAQLAVLIVDHSSENPSPSVTVNFSIDSIGCGDGYNDRSGHYGSPEVCDDGGNASGDGCSPVCTQEPGWDCSSGVCEEVICGDEQVTGDERCDDGGTASGDGCSPTCQPEPGYLCGGSPSTCAQYQPGDMCENALALVAGTYDMTDVLGDLPCDNVCSSSPDRWFTVTVPQGQTLHVHATSTSPLTGNILAFDATDGCGPMHMVSNWHPLGGGQDGHILYMNPSIGPRTIRVAVIQHPVEGEGPMPTFTLAHTLRTIGCGDAFVDQWGEQTASEECDDGNLQNGDGCSSSCTVEAGWECAGAPSWCGLP